MKNLRRKIGLGCVALMMSLAMPFSMQAQSTETTINYRVIDHRSIFQNSKLGQEILRQREVDRESLRTQDAEITDELESEEADLALKRDGMDVEEFSKLADEFSAKSESLRNAYAKEALNFNSVINVRYTRFVSLANKVSYDIAQQNGIQMILPRESVVWVDASADMTSAVIQVLDREYESQKEELDQLIFAPIEAATIETETTDEPITEAYRSSVTEGD